MWKRVVLALLLMMGFCPAVVVAESGGSPETENESSRLVASVPDVRIVSTPPSLTNQVTAKFEFSSSLSSASFKCAIDSGVPFGCSSPLTQRNLKVGDHRFCVFAVDDSGPVNGESVCYSWTIEMTSPIVAISAPSNGEVVHTADPIIQGTTNEPSSTINVYIDDNAQSAGSVVADATGSWTFNKPLGLTDKDYSVSATATDPAGNVGARSAKISFRVNANIADTTIVEHPQQVHSSRHSVFEFASPTGATRFECQLDNAAAGFTDCDQVALFKNLSDGSHTLKVRAKDSAGNVDPTPVEFTWKVDTQSPPGTCNPGEPGGEPQGGCASSGGQPTLVLSLLGGLLLVLTARRRRSS